MLILSLKIGESLWIGEGPNAVQVKFTEAKSGAVRLGIAAPKGVSVDRESVRQRKETEGKRT